MVVARRVSALESPPNSWTPVRRSPQDLRAVIEPRTALYTCPNGHRGMVDVHTIADDGTLSPSVVCAASGCTFHDYVRLEGWEEKP